MLAWFLRNLGVSSEITDHLDQASLAFQRPSVIWWGLLLTVPLGYFIYRRQQINLSSASPLLRAVLTACRVALLVILWVVLAGPFLRIDHRFERRALVAVLLDHSQSMNLPAGPFENEHAEVANARAIGLIAADRPMDPTIRSTLAQMSRAKLAHAALNSAFASVGQQLSERFEFKHFGVGKDLKPVAVDSDSYRLAEPPMPGSTSSNLGAAISTVIEQSAGQPIAGILLLSDGQNTGRLTLAEAARVAAQVSAPVYPVPVGSVTRARDVAIVDVFTPGTVASGDTVSVSVTIESFGFDGRAVQVNLTEGDETLDTRPLTLSGSEQQQIELKYDARSAGLHSLKVQVTALDEEIVHANNHDVVSLRVDDEKIPILYLEGLPRWDFRFIKNGMRRDHGLAATIVSESEWKSSGGAHPVTVPETAQEWTRFRAVMIGDCSPQMLASRHLDSLSEAVREQGVGLVVLAGRNYMPHAFEGTALVDMLPVRLRRDVAGYDAAVHKPFRIEITPAGGSHEPFRLYDEPGRNGRIWSEMPPFFWCAAAVRPAPAATVLAVNDAIEDRFGKLPLIAYHHAGNGKVLFVGTDSTWLWRQNVGDRYFYKFWGQTIRSVCNRDPRGDQKNSIAVYPIRMQPDDMVNVDLFAFAPDGSPRYESQQTVLLTGPGQSGTLTLDADPALKGRFTGTYVPGDEGAYRIEFDPGHGQPVVHAEFHVAGGSDEMRRPSVDRAALEYLAHHSGGAMIELTDLGSIADKLKGEPKLVEVHREETIWDNWFTLSLIVLIYGVDVGLRRLSGLS